MNIEDIREDFSFIESWEDRFEYIIDLGRDLPEFPDHYKTEANRVKGCMSQVWVVPEWKTEGEVTLLDLSVDSDSAIVKGLAAILKVLYSGTPRDGLPAVIAADFFRNIGLEEHLSLYQKERTGFYGKTYSFLLL